MIVDTAFFRRLAMAGIAAPAVLLAGCFTADNDDANPIIPAASMAYPLKPGVWRDCNHKGESCERAELLRREGGGYIRRVFKPRSKGDPIVHESAFRMRLLKGTGIPEETYLVQAIDDDPDQRNLTILSLQQDGGWFQLSPSCEEELTKTAGAILRRVWTDEDDVLHCVLKREGLTDQRLHWLLNAAHDRTGGSVYYEGG